MVLTNTACLHCTFCILMCTFVLPEKQNQDGSSRLNLYYYVRQQKSNVLDYQRPSHGPLQAAWTIGYQGDVPLCVFSCFQPHVLLDHPCLSPAFSLLFKLPVWTRQVEPTKGSW